MATGNVELMHLCFPIRTFAHGNRKDEKDKETEEGKKEE